MNFALFLGWRFLRSKRQESTASRLPRIALIVAILGVTVPVTILSIQNGYMRAIMDRLASISFHLTVDAKDIDDYEALKARIENVKMPDHLYDLGISDGDRHLRSYIPARDETTLEEGWEETATNEFIDYVMPYQQSHALISTTDTVYQAELRGIPADAFDYKPLMENFKFSPPGLSRITENTEILIGEGLASRLGLQPEDFPTKEQRDQGIPAPIVRITLDRASGPDGEKEAFTQPFAAIGVFKSGFKEIDDNMALVLLAAAQDLTQNREISQLGVYLKDIRLQFVARFPIRKVLQAHYKEEGIKKPPSGINSRVKSFSSSNSNLMVALDWEKTQLTIVAVVLIVVAFLTIGLTLYVTVTDKQRQIAILMAMGVRPMQIESIFVAEGMLIAGIGTLAGLLLGGIVIPPLLTEIMGWASELRDSWSTILSWIGIENTLSQMGIGQSAVYNPDSLPYEIQMEDALRILLLGTVVGGVFSYLPARRAARTPPVEVIRNA